MAVKSFKNSGRRAALFVALSALTLPGIAMADQDDGERGGRRHDRGEARADVAVRGDSGQQAARQEQPSRHERADRQDQSGRQDQPARPEPVQHSWRGPNTSGWTPPASPTGEAAAAPQARANTGWDGNGGRVRGDRPDGNRGHPQADRSNGDRSNDGGNWRGRGDNSATVTTQSPGWRGPIRGSTTVHTNDGQIETRGGNRWTGRTDDRRDRGDGSTADSWRDGHRDDSWRNDSWRNDRNRSSYRDHDQRWDNNWRRENRYNWYSYRSHNRSLFSSGSYYSPYRNYSYRRLSIGFFIDSLFYGNRYWINDPWQYRLPDAYGPYRWVRYYDDALLVDIYSGEVVDVINNFFW